MSKFLPPEPTNEMLNAATQHITNTEIYKAMYAAAPNIEHEEVAYVATIEGIKKYVTNYQYEKFSDTIKAFYEPYQSQEIAKLKREKEMLVEALQFYTEDVVYDDDIIGLKVIKTGSKARKALAEFNKEFGDEF